MIGGIICSFMTKENRKIGQKLRLFSQIFFTLASIYTGFLFVLFVNSVKKGNSFSLSTRPPGVEAFLPLSGLIGLKHWILSGHLNTIHPAAVLYLLSFLLISFLLKKGFCSWICPFGFLSEYLWKLGEKLFGKNIKIPKYLDFPLRGIKYLILLFFLWVILFNMGYQDLTNFIYGTYNKAVDIRMLLFFEKISSFSFITISSFVVLSIPIKNFWCRYLCPYGALLGFLSIFSPMKVKRNPEKCINCKICTIKCPSNIEVHRIKVVRSDECNACFRCVETCPVNKTLEMKVGNKTISPKIYLLLILLIFFSFIIIGKSTNHWQTSIKAKEYHYILKNIDSPKFQHR